MSDLFLNLWLCVSGLCACPILRHQIVNPPPCPETGEHIVLTPAACKRNRNFANKVFARPLSSQPNNALDWRGVSSGNDQRLAVEQIRQALGIDVADRQPAPVNRKIGQQG